MNEQIKFISEKISQLENCNSSKSISELHPIMESIDVSVFHSERVLLSKYIDCLARYSEIDKVIAYLELLLKNGLNQRIVAIIGSNTIKKTHGYHKELEFLKMIYNYHSKDSYTLRLFLKSLLSNGQFASAKTIFIEKYDLMSNDDAIEILNLLMRTGNNKFIDNILHILPPDVSSKFRLLINEFAKIDHNSEVDYMHLVISLPSDSRKQELVNFAFRNYNKKYDLISGVYGSHLPDIVYSSLTRNIGNYQLPRGALGCTLSHLKALDTFIKSNKSYCFITEDDGLPLYNFNLKSIIENIPQDFHILVVNERMSSILDTDLTQVNLYSYTNINERLHKFPNNRSGWGTDGYIVTREGALAILSRFEKDGILGHYDGQLFSYGYDTSKLSSQKLNKAESISVSLAGKFIEKMPLNIYTLDFPIISQTNFDFSSIGRENGPD